MTTPRPNGIEIVDWVNLRDIAWKDFRDCVRTLDEQVGIDVILKEARLLEAKRRVELPPTKVLIRKFAAGLARLFGQK